MPLTKVTGGEFDGNSNLSVGSYSVTGVATFSNGPVLVGSGTSSGTSGQVFQATGDAYISGNLGIGVTNPTIKLQVGGVIGFDDTNIKIGDVSTGSSITSGTDNFFAGIGAGSATTTGNYNIFIGRCSGASNTTGGNNNFLGFQAGKANTTGCYNNFFGRNSGVVNTTGIANNFFGFRSGFLNTTGSYNNFFGNSAGRNNTTASNNNFLGLQAGFANTTGSYNNFFGQNAGYCNTTGRDNNFIGAGSGQLNTTGAYNNFFGRVTGYCNTTGNSNNFFGRQAGFANTTGSNNNFLGVQAGFNNTIGGCNNFLGLYSGYNNTTGCYNNFFGLRAGFANISGNHNNFIGSRSGCSNTTGAANFFGGYATGRFNISGNYNIFFGHNAGRNNISGCYNTFFGRQAGCSNTTANNNIFIGNNAGLANTTGCHNNFLGAGSGRYNTTGSFNNFFGQYAGNKNTTASANNFIGACAGLCNTTGTANNFFGRGAGIANTTGNINTFIGHGSGCSNTIGSCNSFLGYYSGGKNTTGNYNTFFGRYAGCSNTTGSHNVAIGNNAQLPSATGSCQLVIGSAGVNWLYGDSLGDVGIGTANPVVPLDVNGNLRIGAATRSGDSGTQLNANLSILPTFSYLSSIDTALEMGAYNTNATNFTGVYRWRLSTTENAARFAISSVGVATNTYNSYGSITERLTITSGGNIGIGITNPLALLTVSSNRENFEFTVGNSTFNGGIIEYINRTTSTTRPDFNYYLGSGSNGAHKFYTNANERFRISSSGNVGIGTTNPTHRLDIFTTSTVSGLRVSSSNDWGNINTPMVDLDGNRFGNGDGNILRVRTGAARTDVEILDVQNGSGTQFVIKGSGNIGVGLADPSVKVHISDSVTSVGSTGTEVLRIANTRVNTGSGAVALRFVNNEISGTNQYTRAQIAAEYDGTSNNNGRLMFATADTNGVLQERARFNGSGAFVLAGGTTTADGIGIAFPATQSASTNANTLDDYEEGTWTPAYRFAGGGSVTYQSQVAVYTKIGRVVYISGRIAVTTISSPSGQAFVSGLPFTPATYTQRINGVTIHRAGSWTTAPIAGTIFETNSGEIEFYKASTTANNTTDLLGSDLAANCFVSFFGQYEV